VGDRPKRLGRYTLVRELGSGGMASVYLARVHGTGGFEKLVALKLVHRHLASDDQFIDMFLDEARIAARISHPNVCGVFDFGETDGVYFIAMEYLLGVPLSDVIRSAARRDDPGAGQDAVALTCHLLGQACEGLHAAHEAKGPDGEPLNVVHRDVSPHNLFVTFDGHVKVVDFGIASAENQLHETATGHVKGKFAYMAPEQLQGKAVDRRADIWSVGVVAWEMLTRRRLFRRRTTMETLFATTSDEVVAPSSIDPRIPPEVDQVVLRALERNRSRRFSTAREMGRELRRIAGTLGAPEVEEWVNALLPEAREEAEARAHEATEVSAPAESLVPKEGEDDESHVRATASTPTAKSRRRAVSALAVGALAVALGTASGAYLAVRPGDEPADEAPEAGEDPVAAGGGFGSSPQTGEPTAGSGGDDAPGRAAPAAAEREPASAEDEPASAEGERGVAGADTAAAGEPGDEGGDRSGDRSGDQSGDRSGDRSGDDAADGVPNPAPAERSPRRSRQRRAARRAARSRASPSRSGRARGTGRVNVVALGTWAEVYHRGRRLGQTPLTVELPAGRQVLLVRERGEGPGRRRAVRITRGETERVVLRPSGG
jgi:serine/threonine-protein kinase